MRNIFFLYALLILGLLLSSGCKENPATQQSKEEEEQTAPTDFKGPVKAITVTEYPFEGEPYSVRYEYNEKGKLTAQQTLTDYDEDEGLNEDLSEKDAQGRYTKQVWGSGDQIYSYQLFKYDDQGRIASASYYQGDGSWNSTTEYTYDEAGRQLSSTTQTPSGSYGTVNEYDGKGHLVKNTNFSNGETTNITTYEIDAAGRESGIHSKNTVSGYEYWNNYSYDKNNELIGSSSYNKEEGGEIQLQRRDTTFFDQNGLKHQRTFENYGNPHTYESTFNKQEHVIHYEAFEGEATHPTHVIDYTYYPDGVTLRERTSRKLVLGQEKSFKTKEFPEELDTFGNWIQRTEGPSFNFSLLESEDDLEDMLMITHRKYEYRGDDQGLNYGFTGKAGAADLRLAYSMDGNILCGEVTVDGNTWRAVGTRDPEDRSLYVVALKENGDIPWSLVIPAGEGAREGTLFQDGAEQIEATFTPTREGLKTYSFATKPEEIVGRYEFAFGGDFPHGTLDVSRCGENWEDVHFEVLRSGAAGTLNFATDDFTDYGLRTEYYRYIWDDENETSRSYEIYFFDGFAVIRTIEWDTNGPTVQGIYAKLPAVG